MKGGIKEGREKVTDKMSILVGKSYDVRTRAVLKQMSFDTYPLRKF